MPLHMTPLEHTQVLHHSLNAGVLAHASLIKDKPLHGSRLRFQCPTRQEMHAINKRHAVSQPTGKAFDIEGCQVEHGQLGQPPNLAQDQPRESLDESGWFEALQW